MGYSPRQEFIYGFRIPEEFLEEREDDISKAEKELNLSVAYTGSPDTGNLDAFIGFELNRGEVVDDDYLGGFHGNRFNLDYFNNWAKESQEKMTPELQQKIREIFSIEEEVEAELWTASSCG